MVKPGFGIFQGRRKSAGNVIEDSDTNLTPDASPATEQSTFRVISKEESEKRRSEQALKKAEKSKGFGRFSNFGSNTKVRSMSIDEESPSSSKRDSKSSSGTSSRPYHGGPYGSSSSTLPSSADMEPNDNIFANLPQRPHISQHNSSPSSTSIAGLRKDLPQLPKSRTEEMSTRYYSNPYVDPIPPSIGTGRARGMTSSSYASTAIPPKLDADLNFGNSDFDNMFEGLDRKPSPDFTKEAPGRSLLAGKRSVQAQPIKIDRQLEVEPPLQSWESRGSDEHLISSPTEDDYPPPPPVPKHKYTQVASHSPTLDASGGFEDRDAKLVRESVLQRKSVREHSPDNKPGYTSSANSYQTPLSSRSASNTTTPKAALRVESTPAAQDENENLFAPDKPEEKTVPKPTLSIPKENNPPPPTVSGEPTRRVMTVAEYQAQRERQMTQPADDSSDDEDYDDEEEAIERREREEQKIREKQRLQLARNTMKRIAPVTSDPTQQAVGGSIPVMGNGFPSELSKEADQWSDEDVPLGILKAHGFPSKNRPPTQPVDLGPSYFRSSTPTLPDRPASAGPTGARGPNEYRPPFARGLPVDPFIGGGLVQPMNRESMGFNQRATSVYGGPTGAMPYQEPQQQFTSLVDRIQMQEMSKPQYMGGASSKNPQQGPFTGQIGNQMHMNQSQNPTRMSQMPMQGMNGMPGMPGMMGMNNMNMMNPMMMAGGMPMMGMNQMNFPGGNPNELMAMQQMMQQMQQMQMMQANMLGQQQLPQDPRMSMLPPLPSQNFAANPNLLGAGLSQPRPMSVMSSAGPQIPQLNRPYSTPQAGGFPSQLGPMPTNNGYTPSIAPSERSNIGLASRYRPVATGNHETASNVSSMTLQASGGASLGPNQKIKGILKGPKLSLPQLKVDEDEEDWSAMVERKSKLRGGAKRDDSLNDIASVVL